MANSRRNLLHLTRASSGKRFAQVTPKALAVPSTTGAMDTNSSFVVSRRLSKRKALLVAQVDSFSRRLMPTRRRS